MITYSVVLGPTSSFFHWSMTEDQIIQQIEWMCIILCTNFMDAGFSTKMEEGHIERMVITFSSSAPLEKLPFF